VTILISIKEENIITKSEKQLVCCWFHDGDWLFAC